MRGTWLFPAPQLLSALEGLLVLCRLNAMLRGHVHIPRWQEPA